MKKIMTLVVMLAMAMPTLWAQEGEENEVQENQPQEQEVQEKQKRNPGEKPYLEGLERKLDPWDVIYDIDTIDDISNLGDDSYEYEGPNPF